MQQFRIIAPGTTPHLLKAQSKESLIRRLRKDPVYNRHKLADIEIIPWSDEGLDVGKLITMLQRFKPNTPVMFPSAGGTGCAGHSLYGIRGLTPMQVQSVSFHNDNETRIVFDVVCLESTVTSTTAS